MTAERPIPRPARPPRAERFDPAGYEARWRDRWEATSSTAPATTTRGQKHYLLTMYPYPSGDLHIGHWYAAIGPDIVARMHRMRGDNVMFPMGFDSLRAAGRERGDRPRHPPRDLDRGEHRAHARPVPDDGRACSTGRARWSASDPEYYRWTQWLFAQFYKAGLAYKAMAPVDWCPKDQVVLAREQVEGADRHCWRCGTPVVKRDLEQWFFRITKLRGRAARLQPDRLAGADPAHADELDRPLRGRRDRLPGRGRWRRADPGLHHAAGHDLRRDLHGAGARAPAGRAS